MNIYKEVSLLYNTSMGNNWNHTEDAKEKIRQAKLELYKNRTTLTNCNKCGDKYKVSLKRLEQGRGKYCSKICQYTDKKGVRYSISTEFKKGQTPWNKGIDFYPSTYKGDAVGMRALHNWVARKLGKPNKCQHCGTVTAKRYEWSNISRQYKRSLDDWQRLCTKCHMNYDGHSIVNNNKKIKL